MPDETSPLDTVKAILAPRADTFVSPAAADQLATLLAGQFGKADPSVLPGVIAAELAQPTYAHYFRQPSPGSLEAIGAQVRAGHAFGGGISNEVSPGVFNLAPGFSSPVEHGTPGGRGVAQTELEELSAYAGKPGVPFGQLSSAEQLYALGQRHRAANVNMSGLQIIPPKK